MPYRSEYEMDQLIKKVRKYLAKPKTIAQLQEKFEVSHATAQRWLLRVGAQSIKQPKKLTKLYQVK